MGISIEMYYKMTACEFSKTLSGVNLAYIYKYDKHKKEYDKHKKEYDKITKNFVDSFSDFKALHLTLGVEKELLENIIPSFVPAVNEFIEEVVNDISVPVTKNGCYELFEFLEYSDN